jgi:hypothetical protein
VVAPWNQNRSPAMRATGLVVGHHRGGHQPVAQVDEEVLQQTLGLRKQAADPPGGDLHADQVGQGLGGAGHGQVLVGQQVRTHPRDHRPEDRRGGGLRRELPRAQAPAGTAQSLDDMGGDHDRRGGDVEDLAGLGGHHLGVGQGCTAARTDRGRVGDDDVGVGHPGQVGARGTGLLALGPLGLAFARPPLAPGLLGLVLGQGATRGGL